MLIFLYRCNILHSSIVFIYRRHFPAIMTERTWDTAMKITDHIDLLYPSKEARDHAEMRRLKMRDSGSLYIKDLMIGDIKNFITLTGSEKLLALCEELCDDIQTIEYRLDCLEDYLNNPDLADSFRKVITELSVSLVSNNDEDVNAFYDVKQKMDELDGFLTSIAAINGIYKRIGTTIKSQAMCGMFEFFLALPESDDYKEIAKTLTELQGTFAKTIRSVKVGINFDANMNPDSAGLLEVGYDKIYPKGNILEKIVYGVQKNKETFSGEEHLNSLTRHTPADIDTALFRELTEYTTVFAKRISEALKSYRSSFFSDIKEIERQLDLYEGVASFIKGVRAHGMKMCRPKILSASERKTVLKGVYDLVFYKEIVMRDPSAVLTDKIKTNDLILDDSARLYMVTGANNGGKTTFARACGICQVLAQAGLFVPAESAEVSVCDNIFTHFPRDEEAGIDTSRFTNEIKDLKVIAQNMTEHSFVILNESLQSTTPEECLEIAKIHTELFASAGVRGLYVTHLTGLYKAFEELNQKDYPTKLDSLVSVAGEGDERLYKIVRQPPSGESLAMSIYRKFGATLDDIKSGEVNG